MAAQEEETKKLHKAPSELPGLDKGKSQPPPPPPGQAKGAELLPSNTPFSVSLDGSAAFFSNIVSIFAAQLVNDDVRATKAALHLLRLCEALAGVLPTPQFGIFFAAALDGERSSKKLRHGRHMEPEKAQEALKAAVSFYNSRDRTAKKRGTRRIKRTLLKVLSALPLNIKSDIRRTVLCIIVDTLQKNAKTFPKLAANSTWFRVADEDAFAIPGWSCPVHIIVSCDKDTLMANCHCANDDRIVIQVVLLGDGSVYVRNARTIKAAICRENVPVLAHVPEAWWSRTEIAVNFENPEEVWTWKAMVLIESFRGMSDFAGVFLLFRER